MDHIILIPSINMELFYSRSSREHECIGHLRGDFGRDGTEFWTNWFPHEAAMHNTPEFREEFQLFMNSLRASLLKNRSSMRSYLRENPNIIEQTGSIEQHGYFTQTERHEYYVRCNPAIGEYNFYIYCYLRKKDAIAFSEYMKTAEE